MQKQKDELLSLLSIDNDIVQRAEQPTTTPEEYKEKLADVAQEINELFPGPNWSQEDRNLLTQTLCNF